MLPNPIMVSEPGSFAEHTIITRKPEIIRQIIEANSYGPKTIEALRGFANEIATRNIAPPTAETDDLAEWRTAWQQWKGSSWRQVEWYFAEAFFYRRLLETVGYFQDATKDQDPFAATKTAALAQGVGALGRFVSQTEPQEYRQQFTRWLMRSLWGNRVDLSNLLVAQDGQHDLAYQDAQWLLIDRSASIWKTLSSSETKRLDIIADNSGLELLSDLGLIAWVLRIGLVDTIHLHLKRHPFFVSDARMTDLTITFEALCKADEPGLRMIAHELSVARDDGRLLVEDHPFWNSPWHFSAMPANLRNDLEAADLLIFKGDANYRRLVEDRHWPAETPLAKVAAHMPRPLAALRTVKSELILGLKPGQAHEIENKDPQWMLNGRWGVIDWVP